MSRWPLTALVVLFGLGGAAAPPEHPPEPPPVRVEYRDGRLTVDATKFPTMLLLARIGDATGAWIRGEVHDPPTVTISLRDTPVRQAIDRIVGRTNFTLRYGTDGTLRGISLRGLPSAAPPPPPPAPAPPAPGNRLALLRLHRVWKASPPVALPGALARVLGTDAVPLPRLLRSLRSLDDVALRRKAIGAFVRGVEGDPEVRAAWRSLDAHQLANLARRQTGPSAAELLRTIASTARDGRSRETARAAADLVTSSAR